MCEQIAAMWDGGVVFSTNSAFRLLLNLGLIFVPP